MEFTRIWVLRGPNVWTRFPALEVELDLKDLHGKTSSDLPGTSDRLVRWMANLEGQRPGRGLRDGFLQRLQNGTPLPYLLKHLTLALQSLAGSDVAFALAQEMDTPGRYRVVVEYEEEALGRACLGAARDLCLAAIHDRPFDVAAVLEKLSDLAHDARLGPSTGAIVQAAHQRNIPTHRLNEGSLVQLGHGVHQRRILTAETDRTGAIAEAIAQDKQLTRSLLQAIGVPVPEGQVVQNAEEAWRAAEEIGLPVVVKPQYGNHGRGVATNLTTREQVRKAFEAALEEGSSVLVETYIPGSDYRLLVIGDRLVAAARREPAHVLGTGMATIRQLIDEVNKDPRRSDGHSTVLSFIKLDPVALGVLEEQGFTPDSVPPPGVRVLIRRNGNLSTGGTALDVTDDVHPEVAARAVDAAHVVGLDIAGVDVVVTDVSRPLEEQRGAIVEVNAGPGLRMHLQPSEGKPRAVGNAIVEMLYPDGQTGRIPIVAVTGVNGKTTTTRLIAHILRGAGRCVGMTCTDGAFIDGRCIESRDCSGPRSARAVLLNPRVEAAVLESARGGILREGLGFDRCDVGIVTNLGKGDHFGLRGVHTLDDLAQVKRVVVESVAPTGMAVLNADDPPVAAMAEHCPGQVTYFAREGSQSILVAHRPNGGRGVFVREGAIILAEGNREETLTHLDQIPSTLQGRIGFQVENVLATVAALWALDLPFGAIRSGLASFSGDLQQSPGRFNVLSVNGATIVVDYAHNVTALAAVVEAVAQFPPGRRSLMYSTANRLDPEVIDMAEVVGNGFDRVLLYEGATARDRSEGELTALVRRGLANGQRVKEILETATEREAILLALRTLQPDEVLVLCLEEIPNAIAFLQTQLGETFSLTS